MTAQFKPPRGAGKRTHIPVGRRRRDIVTAVGADHAKIAAKLDRLSGLTVVRARRAQADDDASGDMIVMSRANYRELLERAEDATATAAHQRSRGEERVPLAVIKRLMAGDPPVRVWREHRDLTLAALAAKADLSISYASEIEHGQKPGSLKALRALAAAMALELDDLTSWL